MAPAAWKEACEPQKRVGVAALPGAGAGPSLVFMNAATFHRLPSFRSLASSPRRGLVEVATLAGLYGVYELVRGQGHATLEAARAHTDGIVTLEQNLHVFGEREIQRAAHWLPGLPTLLGIAYIALHFLGTAAFLLWLHRRHPEKFAFVRNTLVGATGVALAIYLLFPVAPPRLAGLGFVDTVSHNAKVNLSSDLLGSLYNPFAAVPSLHFGYALLVGVTIAMVARGRVARIIGWSYPVAMLFIIVATGNHFFFDALAGGLAIGAGYVVASWVESPARRAPRWQPAPESAAALS
jgi:PAP2 superfamily protein